MCQVQVGGKEGEGGGGAVRYECMIWSIIVLLWTAQYHKTLGTVYGGGFNCRSRKAKPLDDPFGRWNRVSGKCHLQDLNRHLSNIERAANTVQCHSLTVMSCHLMSIEIH